MKMDARMPEQPPMHRRRPMGREVVQHDVDLQRGCDAALDLTEERHEILGAMLLFTPRQDFAGRDVERGEQIERAIPDVVVGPPFGLANVHGQDRLGPLERLDLRLLVEGEHHRVVRRIHIQADDIPNLVDELGVGRHLERLRDVRFEPERPPDAADHRVTHPGLRGHRPRAPVGLALRGRFERLDDHRLDVRVGDRPWPADPGLIQQARESALDESLSPFPHGAIGGAIPTRHHRVRRHVGAREHQASPKRQETIHVGSLRQPYQFGALDFCDHQGRLGTTDLCHAPYKITRRIVFLENPFPGD